MDAYVRCGERATLAPPPERLVQFGGVDAVLPDQVIGDDNCVGVDDPGSGGRIAPFSALSYYGVTLTPGPFGTDLAWPSAGGEVRMTKRFQAIIVALATALAAAVAKPAPAENILRWASATEALTFDPHAASHTPTQAATWQVYEPLVDFNSSYEIEPSLAVAWKLTSPTTWQFDLRQGVRFHDGTPFTSEDVVFSLNRALSETSDMRAYVSLIQAIDVVDDHTVRITTTTPNPILPDELSLILIMSKRWAEKHDALLPAAYGDTVTSYAESHANGTGPFKLVSFEPSVRTVMERNQDWWGLGQNAHNLDGIVHTVIKDPALRLQALLSGEIDLLSDPPLADLDRIEGRPGLRLERTNEFRTIFLGFDQGSRELRSSEIKGSNPFSDRRVRQAVYQAIDEQTIVDEVMSGLAIPAGIIIQPGINGYAPELDTRLPFDPKAAKQLLATAGYPGGFAVTLDCPNDRYINDEAICREVAAMLGEIGVRVTLAARPMREHLPKIKNRETDFYMLGWSTSYFDSKEQFSYLIRSDAPYNATGYANAHVDDMIDAIETAVVTYGRDATIEEVWKIVRDDIIYVPLHHQVIVWAMRDQLELPVDGQNFPRFRLARLKETRH
jgi:peptide/nickel transport system substrate-binding protein